MAATIMQTLAVLASAFPQAKIEPATLAVYKMALSDIDPAILESAVRTIINKSRFWPTVAEIREIAIGKGYTFRPGHRQTVSDYSDAEIEAARAVERGMKWIEAPEGA